MELYLKFGQNPMSLRASRTSLKMTFVAFWPELMMIWMLLTGAGVLDDVLDGLHMP